MYSKGQAEMEMRTEKGLHVGGLCSVPSFRFMLVSCGAGKAILCV